METPDLKLSPKPWGTLAEVFSWSVRVESYLSYASNIRYPGFACKISKTNFIANSVMNWTFNMRNIDHIIWSYFKHLNFSYLNCLIVHLSMKRLSSIPSLLEFGTKLIIISEWFLEVIKLFQIIILGYIDLNKN